MLACAHAQHCGLATLNGPPDAPKQASCSGATTNCSPTGYARDAAPCAVQAQSNCVSMKAHMNAASWTHLHTSRRAGVRLAAYNRPLTPTQLISAMRHGPTDRCVAVWCIPTTPSTKQESMLPKQPTLLSLSEPTGFLHPQHSPKNIQIPAAGRSYEPNGAQPLLLYLAVLHVVHSQLTLLPGNTNQPHLLATGPAGQR